MDVTNLLSRIAFPSKFSGFPAQSFTTTYMWVVHMTWQRARYVCITHYFKHKKSTFDVLKLPLNKLQLAPITPRLPQWS